MTSSKAAREMARHAADLAADRKASDIVILDLSGLSSFTDYFVICTARSDIQVRAVCERVMQGMKEAGHAPLSAEGVGHGQWGLLDFGEVVVHAFQASTRELYDLEKLWLDAPRWTYEPGSVIEHSRA